MATSSLLKVWLAFPSVWLRPLCIYGRGLGQNLAFLRQICKALSRDGLFKVTRSNCLPLKFAKLRFISNARMVTKFEEGT